MTSGPHQMNMGRPVFSRSLIVSAGLAQFSGEPGGFDGHSNTRVNLPVSPPPFGNLPKNWLQTAQLHPCSFDCCDMAGGIRTWKQSLQALQAAPRCRRSVSLSLGAVNSAVAAFSMPSAITERPS
jgi:hypothetical protein